jgi:NAD(P)-dependent dehydrogenase (short-subunit alcohol dehydrogenase family)
MLRRRSDSNLKIDPVFKGRYMLDPSLEGRVALVTGGARGLGRVMALALVEAGANVLIIARSADQLAQTVEEAKRLGKGRCEGFATDIGKDEDCRAAAAEAVRLFGPVDVLVNNAAGGMGVWQPKHPAPFHALNPAGIETMLNINLMGTYRMFCAVVPAMVERRFGKVITISTSRPTMRIPFAGPYGPIKAALETTTLIWAEELHDSGVTANVLLPGGISDTSLIPGDNVGKRAKPFAAGKGPVGMEGRSCDLLPPEIMAPPILWLASDGSNGTSGRRFVARDWDPDLPPAEAAERAMQKPAEVLTIM